MDEAATLFGPVWFWHIQKHTTCHLLEDKSVSESVFLIWNLAILVVCLKMGVPPNPWNVHGIFWIGFFMKNKHPFFGVSP